MAVLALAPSDLVGEREQQVARTLPRSEQRIDRRREQGLERGAFLDLPRLHSATSRGRAGTQNFLNNSSISNFRDRETALSDALAVHLADAVGRQVDQDARQVVGFLLEVVAAFGAGVLAEPRRARLESVARVRLRHLYSRRSEASEELRCAR